MTAPTRPPAATTPPRERENGVAVEPRPRPVAANGVGSTNGRVEAPAPSVAVAPTTEAVVAPAAAPSTAAALAAPPTPTRRFRRWLILPVIALLLIVAGYIGYRFWYEETHFVTTENAQVAGALTQFGSLNPGRVMLVHVDVGGRVTKDQEVAVVALPAPATTTTSGVTRLTYTGSDDERVSVKAPFDGVVVARMSHPGDTVQAGQAMLAIVEPGRFWVTANIEETKIGRVRAGQYVEVKPDYLGRVLHGHVQAIIPATASTFSLLPPQNTTGNFNKVTQLVPVKIAIDETTDRLVLGASVEVRIHINETGE